MIVLDANILIRAVLGRRVRQLVEIYSAQGVHFVAPDVAFNDAQKYLPPLLKKRGTRPFVIFLESHLAFAQSTSFCTAGVPLRPIAPTTSPFTLMGNPPPHAAT
jgi:hypothetical protein